MKLTKGVGRHRSPAQTSENPQDNTNAAGVKRYLHEMEAHGVSRDALRRMTHTLPAQLLGLEDAAE